MMRYLLDKEAIQKAADEYSIGDVEVRDILNLYFKYAGRNFFTPKKKNKWYNISYIGKKLYLQNNVIYDGYAPFLEK